MDDESMNRYEKQLYTVFKTFDVDNEEALDRSAVYELCDALQLEDRGTSLVNTLFERHTDRVTFAQFRNGLLAVLGGASGDPAPAVAATPGLQPDPPSLQSDDDSSGREVAPKFVFGSKKYGRRSRPPRTTNSGDTPPSPRSSSASRLDTDDKRARQRMRCRRSASAMESRNESGVSDTSDINSAPVESFEHDRRIDKNEALALCRGLHMGGIDRQLVERIFEDSGAKDTTVGEFFDRLNTSLTSTIEETSRDACTTATAGGIASGDPCDDEAGAGVSSDLVLEAWERAGVQQPRRLLLELGFGASALRPPELERALDDELSALPDEPAQRALLLAAALALSRLRRDLARRRADLAAAERDKLRADVAEANRRARLLAQEVDESHARIEAELKANVKRTEVRQAELARQAAADSAAERERAAAARAQLEAELARRADHELRLRTELGAVRERADELELRACAADERAAQAERECARLAGDLRAALERSAAAAAQCGDSAELSARLRELRAENQQLRDRNDEMCAALEAAARTAESRPPDSSRGGHLSAELDSLLAQDRSEECDSSPASMDQWILSQCEAVTRLGEIFEGIQTVRFPDGNVCGSCGAVAEQVQLLQARAAELGAALVLGEPPRHHAAAQTDPDAEALALQRKHEDEKQKLTGLIKDLEASLEQMKAEYDKCEEYWSGKLEEERDAYNEEQRLGDERLAELVAKIGEYERQFASAALPTIEERHSLEAQFTDLEEEFARYRRDKEAELSAAAGDAARHAERADALERRLAAAPALAPPSLPAPAPPAPAPPAEVRELRTRCARAEAAVRRLHSRLAAADVLVKDLYVENCQLAHRRPL